tara:strand:- start:590 stop:1204 length:615 start_codon:yes stop_codon:yes gene_type:complete
MEKEIAKLLLQINAIKLEPKKLFIWASGKKSPIYCDNRLILSYPKIRSYVQKCFLETFKSHFQKADVIAGVATGGIPHGALLADKLKLPFVYIRSSAKKHGRKNRVEGVINKGANVLVVEDLVSTGKSSLSAIYPLLEIDCNITGLISIFSYNFPDTIKLISENNIKHRSLCNYDVLIQTAIEENFVSTQELEFLEKWNQNFKI